MSACTTASNTRRLANGAIHIASAVQLAGFEHVVGTLSLTDVTISYEIVRDFTTI